MIYLQNLFSWNKLIPWKIQYIVWMRANVCTKCLHITAFNFFSFLTFSLLSLYNCTHLICLFTHIVHMKIKSLPVNLGTDLCQCCNIFTHADTYTIIFLMTGCFPKSCITFQRRDLCLGLTFSFLSSHTLWMNHNMNNKCLTGI